MCVKSISGGVRQKRGGTFKRKRREDWDVRRVVMESVWRHRAVSLSDLALLRCRCCCCFFFFLSGDWRLLQYTSQRGGARSESGGGWPGLQVCGLDRLLLLSCQFLCLLRGWCVKVWMRLWSPCSFGISHNGCFRHMDIITVKAFFCLFWYWF